MALIPPDQRLHALLDDYLQHSTCSIPDLERLLSSRHEKDAHIPSYETELVERFLIMGDIQKHLSDTSAGQKQLTRIAASFYLIIPIQRLRPLLSEKELQYLEEDIEDLETNIHFYQTGNLKLPKAQGEARQSQAGTKRKSPSRASEVKHSHKRGTSRPSLPLNLEEEEELGEEYEEKNSSAGEQLLHYHRLMEFPRFWEILPSSQIPTHINRNSAERRICLERNPKCIWTGSSHVDAYHVIPFSLHGDTKKKQQIRKSIDGLLAYIGDQHQLASLLHSTQSPDKAWNMLTLSKTLHHAWSQAEVAFKVDGTKYHTKGKVRLQLRIFFLNVRNWGPNEKFELNLQNIRELATNRFLSEPLPSKRFYRDEDGTQIMSGHKAEVILPSEDVGMLQQLIEFQWHVLNISAMSGAAKTFALARLEDSEPPEPKPEPKLYTMHSPSHSEVFEHIKQWIDSSVAISEAPEEQPLCGESTEAMPI